mgnify:FL=1
MRKEHRLVDRRDFQEVYKKGRSVANAQFVVYFLKRGDVGAFRAGVSAGRKLGKAVVRNRVRRLVKEALRLNAERISPGYDIIVVVRKAAVGLSFAEVQRCLLHALRKASLLNGPEL